MADKVIMHEVFIEKGKAYVACSRCNRLLYAEHGPTCPECVALNEADKKIAETEAE